MTKTEKLEKQQRIFEDFALELQSNHNCDRILMSTKTGSLLCKHIALTLKVLRENE